MVTAVDVSPEMMAIARKRCDRFSDTVTFLQGSAEALEIDDVSLDAIYCQQGFQFFPDKTLVAQEMHRVLRSGERLALTTWCPVEQCCVFGVVRDVLIRLGHNELGKLIAVPFDFMPEDVLHGHFATAGFTDLEIQTHAMDVIFPKGPPQVFDLILASPLGPPLRELPEEKLAVCRQELLDDLETMTVDGVTQSAMESLVLTAKK
jgi:SAM-dependent methyltransferase